MAFVVDGYETNQCWRVRDWTEEKKKFWTRQYILLMFGVLLYKTTNNVCVCVCAADDDLVDVLQSSTYNQWTTAAMNYGSSVTHLWNPAKVGSI